MKPQPLTRVLGQSLLVAGSAVGAGLLALPAVTSRAGLLPSTLALTLVWAYMYASALLLIEAASWMDPSRPAHLLGLASSTLGRAGRNSVLVLYVVVYSATMTAYVAEGGRQAVELLAVLSGGTIASSSSSHHIALGQIMFSGIFGFVIYRGSNYVEKLNAIFMVGAMIAFTLLVTYAAGSRSDDALDTMTLKAEMKLAEANATLSSDETRRALTADGMSDWAALPRALPVIVVAFSYHNMVPSVFSAVDRNSKLAGTSILIGSGISLAMYVVWLSACLGGAQGDNSEPMTKEAIFTKLEVSAGTVLPLFSFLALVTSVLGVGLGCVDFLEDAMSSITANMISTSFLGIVSLSREERRRLNATLVTFCPCLIVAIAFPRAFLPLLELSGIFRLALFGAIPVAMVWKGRKVQHHLKADTYVELAKLRNRDGANEGLDNYGVGVHVELLPGGQISLAFVLVLTLSIAGLEITHIASEFMHAIS